MGSQIPGPLPSVEPAAADCVHVSGAPDLVMPDNTGSENHANRPARVKAGLAGEALEHARELRGQVRRNQPGLGW